MGKVMHVPPGLTATELRMLQLAADGLDNYDIADQLRMGVGTIGKAFQRIYDKTGIRTQTPARLQRKEAVWRYMTGEAFDG